MLGSCVINKRRYPDRKTGGQGAVDPLIAYNSTALDRNSEVKQK